MLSGQRSYKEHLHRTLKLVTEGEKPTSKWTSDQKAEVSQREELWKSHNSHNDNYDFLLLNKNNIFFSKGI